MLIEEHHVGKPWFRRFKWHHDLILGLCARCHRKLTILQQWRKRHSLNGAAEAEHLAYAFFDIADLIEISVERNGGRTRDWHTVTDLRRQADALLNSTPADQGNLVQRGRFQVHYYARSLVRNVDWLRAFFAGSPPNEWWSDDFWGPVETVSIEPHEFEAIENDFEGEAISCRAGADKVARHWSADKTSVGDELALRPGGKRLPIMLRAVPILGSGRNRGKVDKATAGDCDIFFKCLPVADPDSGQALYIGFYQVRCRGEQVHKAQNQKEAGFFYNPKTVTAETLAHIREYAAQSGFRVLPAWDIAQKRDGRFVVTEPGFVSAVLLKYGYELRGTVIGADLPRDFGLLALRSAVGRRGWNGSGLPGGFSLILSENTYKPRLKVKKLGPAFSIAWAKPTKSVGWSASARRRIERGDQSLPPFWPGRFIDVLHAGHCLSAEKPENLADLAVRLRVLTGSPLDGQIRRGDKVSLESLPAEVAVIEQCHSVLARQLTAHGLAKDIGLHDLISTASIAKLHFRAMGIDGRTAASGLPDWLISALMVTLHGGRAEVRMPGKIVQGRYCDVRSMYPTVAVLEGLSSFATAQGVRWHDVTAETQTFLNNVELKDLLRLETWQRPPTIVYVQPHFVRLPVRAPYGSNDELTTGLNDLTSPKPICFTLADAIAAKLLTKKPPVILHAIAFKPGLQQRTLKPHTMFGKPEWMVDPREDDPFLHLAKLRQKVKEGTRADLDAEGRQSLDVADAALKIMANSGCSGIFAEMNVTTFQTPHAVSIILDAAPLENASPAERRMRHIEKAGNCFHPLIATTVYGGARLMLAILQQLVIEQGLEWAFCDTDSLFIVQPDGMDFAEFNKRCDRVGDQIETLNPYKDGQPLLKTEPENFDKDTHELIPLSCYPIVPKRYVLFNVGLGGKITFRKVSRHALGTILPPDPEDNNSREIGRQFHRRIWEAGLSAKINGRAVDLSKIPGIRKPAMSRIVNHSPELGVHESIRPGTPLSSFVMKDEYAKGENGNPIHPIALYHPDPDVAAQDALTASRSSLFRFGS